MPAPFGGIRGMLVASLLAALIGATRLRLALWWASGALAALLLVVAYTPVVRGPAQALIRSDAPTATPVDAVVALSASVTDEGALSPSGRDRLLAAVAVAQAEGATELVVSAVAMRTVRGRVTSLADQRALVALLAPRLRLHVVSPVSNTRDEALGTRALARRQGWRRVAVVTSPPHTRRACAAFERVGLAVRCVAAQSSTAAWSVLDSPRDRIRALADLAYERAALWLYGRRGWI